MYSIYAGDELLYSDVYPLETRKVTSPTLKMGVDEAGSLEFTVSEVNKCYTKLLRMKTIITVKKLNPMTHAEEPIWDGRILREDRDFYNNKKLYIEGALAFLNDSTQPIKEYKNKSLAELMGDGTDINRTKGILWEHNNTIKDPSRYIYWGGKADTFNPPDLEYWSTGYEYTLDAVRSLAEYLEGHFIVRKDPIDGKNKLYFFKDEYQMAKQSIVFGKNLMDYTENYDLSKLATVLLPLCPTERETADPPRIVGTDIDLTTQTDWDDNKKYAVLMPLTNDVICRKQLTAGDVTANVHVPEHRNHLNILLKDVDPDNPDVKYRLDKPNYLGVFNSDDTFDIPEYVKIWACNPRFYRSSSLSDAQDCPIEVVVDNGASHFNFDFVSTFNMLILQDSAARSAENNHYSFDWRRDNGAPRTHRELIKKQFNNFIDNYGIFTKSVGYQTAIIELDVTRYKTIYLSCNGPDFGSNFRTLTLWKKSSSFDENTSWVKHASLKLPSTNEPIIHVTYEDWHMSEEQDARFYAIGCATVGYNFQNGTEHIAPNFVQDDSGLPWVLNYNKYTIAKEFNESKCFEKKIDIGYTPANGEDPRMLLVVCGTRGSIGLTLVTDDDKEVDTTVSIGLDANGINVNDTYPYRGIYENNQWTGRSDEQHSEQGPPCYPWVIYADSANDTTPIAGYGVLVKATDGVRLLDQNELNAISGSVHFNVLNSGEFNLTNAPVESIVKTTSDSNYRTMVYVTRASYEDNHGKKYPNSFYLSATMNGRAMIYCIFEFTDGHDANGLWDGSGDAQDPQPSNHPAHGLIMHDQKEFGKYISGTTILDAKKITMPYSKTQGRLMFIVVCSYGTDPKIWMHDPKLANKLQYLTVSAANNGNAKLIADSSNRFLSVLEYGDIDTQTGSPLYTSTKNRIRTRDFITIPSSGNYLLSYDGSGVEADTYLYSRSNSDDTTNGYFKHTEYKAANPYIVLPYLYDGDKIKVVFKKNSDEDLSTIDVKNIMLYSESSSKNMLFTQGKLASSTDPETGIVTINVDDESADSGDYVTSADFYKITARKCKLLARVDLEKLNLPVTYIIDDYGYPISSTIVYIDTWSLTPELVTDPITNVVSVVYKECVRHVQTNNGIVEIAALENEQYRFQVSIRVAYKDSDEELHFATIPVQPNYIKTFSVSQLVNEKKEYVPANNSYETYGYIEKRIEFEDAESSQELLERAQKYLRQSQFDEMQLKVKALDMTLMGAQVDNLHVGDKINVSSPPHGLYRDFVIREMSIPFDKPENTTFELGWDNKDSLAKLIRKEKSKW